MSKKQGCKQIKEDIRAAKRALTVEAKRIGTTVAWLTRIALWNMVADLEGTSLADALEVACLDSDP